MSFVFLLRYRPGTALSAQHRCSQLLFSGAPGHGHWYSGLRSRSGLLRIRSAWPISFGCIRLEERDDNHRRNNAERVRVRTAAPAAPAREAHEETAGEEHHRPPEGADGASHGTTSQGIRMQYVVDRKGPRGFQEDTADQVGERDRASRARLLFGFRVRSELRPTTRPDRDAHDRPADGLLDEQLRLPGRHQFHDAGHTRDRKSVV